MEFSLSPSPRFGDFGEDPIAGHLQVCPLLVFGLLQCVLRDRKLITDTKSTSKLDINSPRLYVDRPVRLDKSPELPDLGLVGVNNATSLASVPPLQPHFFRVAGGKHCADTIDA